MTDSEEKIAEAVAKALSHLKEAEKAQKNNDNSAYKSSLWKSTAEAEYAAFQIAIAHSLTEYSPSQNHSAATESSDNRGRATQMLQDAQARLRSEPKEAYAAIRNAVTLIRRMISEIEKSDKTERGEANPQDGARSTS